MSRTQQIIFLKLKHKLDRNYQYCFYLREKAQLSRNAPFFRQTKKIVRSELLTYFFWNFSVWSRKQYVPQEITGKLNLCERCYATQIYVLLTLPIEFLLINLNIVLLFKTSLKWEIRYLYIMKKTLIKRKKQQGIILLFTVSKDQCTFKETVRVRSNFPSTLQNIQNQCLR